MDISDDQIVEIARFHALNDSERNAIIDCLRLARRISKTQKDGSALESLEHRVLEWAEEKGIIGTNCEGTPHSQAEKLDEEAAEVRQAVWSGDIGKTRMELGDVFVVAILLAWFAGTDMEHCLGLALEKITQRTGRMEGGVFVKDEDDGHHD